MNEILEDLKLNKIVEQILVRPLGGRAVNAGKDATETMSPIPNHEHILVYCKKKPRDKTLIQRYRKIAIELNYEKIFPDPLLGHNTNPEDFFGCKSY